MKSGERRGGGGEIGAEDMGGVMRPVGNIMSPLPNQLLRRLATTSDGNAGGECLNLVSIFRVRVVGVACGSTLSWQSSRRGAGSFLRFPVSIREPLLAIPIEDTPPS